MRILENQSYFLHEKSQLEIEISKRGDKCSIHPKFLGELYYIEYYWVAAKRYTRENYAIPLWSLSILYELALTLLVDEQFGDFRIGQDGG